MKCKKIFSGNKNIAAGSISESIHFETNAAEPPEALTCTSKSSNSLEFTWNTPTIRGQDNSFSYIYDLQKGKKPCPKGFGWTKNC